MIKAHAHYLIWSLGLLVLMLSCTPRLANTPNDVKRQLDRGFDPNQAMGEAYGCEGNPHTPLGRAARWGDVRIVELLLEHGADPNMKACGPSSRVCKYRDESTGRSEKKFCLEYDDATPIELVILGAQMRALEIQKMEAERKVRDPERLNEYWDITIENLSKPRWGDVEEIIRLLLAHGAIVAGEDGGLATLALGTDSPGMHEVAVLLANHGAIADNTKTTILPRWLAVAIGAD